MIMDKTRSQILQTMFNTLGQTEGLEMMMAHFKEKDEKNGNTDFVDELKAMTREFADMVHEHGYCVDKSCQK